MKIALVAALILVSTVADADLRRRRREPRPAPEATATVTISMQDYKKVIEQFDNYESKPEIDIMSGKITMTCAQTTSIEQTCVIEKAR